MSQETREQLVQEAIALSGIIAGDGVAVLTRVDRTRGTFVCDMKGQTVNEIALAYAVLQHTVEKVIAEMDAATPGIQFASRVAHALNGLRKHDASLPGLLASINVRQVPGDLAGEGGG